MRFDKTDLQIIKCLQEDARTSFTVIAKKLGLSISAVQSRFNKMKEAGLILGATIEVNQYRTSLYCTIIGVKTVASNTSSVLGYLKNLKIGRDCSVYCYEALISHYNINIVMIHKDVLDIHLIKDMILEHPGVIEVNANLITEHLKSDYKTLNLRNLIGRRL